MKDRYFYFQESQMPGLSDEENERKYGAGFVFTRVDKGHMLQTTSVRVPLRACSLSSENRRVLRTHAWIHLQYVPLSSFTYHWSIGKMAKDFYLRFGEGIMSANKIRQLFITPEVTNMNAVLVYHGRTDAPVGYCLIFCTDRILHYAYPFHDVSQELAHPSLGMAMMTLAVMWAKEVGKDYIYLGSIQNEKSLYKFQFKGIEWFDGKEWRLGKPEKSQIQISNVK